MLFTPPKFVRLPLEVAFFTYSERGREAVRDIQSKRMGHNNEMKLVFEDIAVLFLLSN